MLVKIISVMLENTYTTDDLVERLALMRRYYGSRLFSGGTETVLRDMLSGACEPHTLEILESWQAAFKKQAISPLVVYEALDAIEEDLGGVPSVTLYVPVRFSAEHVERFGKWFRANVQPNILLSLRTDARTAGGCSFVWKDTYYDRSLRYFMHVRRDAIIESFNHLTHVE
jgi:hypothetical protein